MEVFKKHTEQHDRHNITLNITCKQHDRLKFKTIFHHFPMPDCTGCAVHLFSIYCATKRVYRNGRVFKWECYTGLIFNCTENFSPCHCFLKDQVTKVCIASHENTPFVQIYWSQFYLHWTLEILWGALSMGILKWWGMGKFRGFSGCVCEFVGCYLGRCSL